MTEPTNEELIARLRQAPNIENARILAPGSRVPEVIVPLVIARAAADRLATLTSEPSDAPTRDGFVPCPFCKQYSHSIGEDDLAKAILHFESMYAHPIRGTPMGHHFDEQTRDYAQMLVAAAKAKK